MVDQWTGEWTEEKDYSTYPKEKWCDYDYMAVWIREQKYEPKTSMENLITNIFLHYDCETEEESSSYNTENGNFEGTYVEAIQAYVADTGLSEFDYEAQIGVMEMKRTPKVIKQQTEEWLDERWMIANMKDTRPQDMCYYMGALKALEFAGYEWKRDVNGKHTLFKC